VLLSGYALLPGLEAMEYAAAGQTGMLPHLKRLRQVLQTLRQNISELENSVLDIEEAMQREQALELSPRQEEDGSLDLLSLKEVSQKLGMGKSWVYQRIRNGEIPSVKLGNNIKVRRKDLQEYVGARSYPPPPKEE
jgi:excisionase family DNA binding protein